MIEIIDLQKSYSDLHVLKGINTIINDGDIISIVGGSGCGKSTFIRCLNMLEKPTGGQIILDGEEISKKGYDLRKISHKIGMVFQSFNLFNHLTVIENLMLPQINLLKVSKQEAYDTAMSLLHQVNLTSKILSYPKSLSGGQKQRVAIARTLAMNPEVILFDEPTSALDPTMVGEVESTIKNLTSTGKTMLIVTHDMDFAKSISNRVFYIDEGIIYEEGSPEEIFNNPKKEKTKHFVNGLKEIYLNINSNDYSFVETSSLIIEYCKKNQLPYDKAYYIQSVFEELCDQILLLEFDEIDISFVIEYSQSDNTVNIIVRYGNREFDINNAKNKLSLNVIKGLTKSIVYEKTSGQYINKLTLSI